MQDGGQVGAEWTLRLAFRVREGMVDMNKALCRLKCGTESRWEKNSPPTRILSEGGHAGLQNVTRRGDGREQALRCSKHRSEGRCWQKRPPSHVLSERGG